MPKPTDIRVVLVRCGRTAWDDAARLQGRTDLPLSESGREAVAANIRDLIAAGAESHPTTVYCAEDEASRQTSELLASETGARVRTDEDLAGLDLGIWDGLLESQVLERFPTAFRQWKERPSTVTPPEGETFESAGARLRLTMGRLLEKANGKPVAFVLRPLAYGLATCWLEGKPGDQLWGVLEDGPQVQRLTVTRQFVRDTLEALKAKA